MKLGRIFNRVVDKNNFSDIRGYVAFCSEYLRFVGGSLQAVIISQNENHYHFYQYKADGNFQITRPINSRLMYSAGEFVEASRAYLELLRCAKSIGKSDAAARKILNNVTYTIQQCIGSALDGLPAGQTNTARKLNGDLFEHLVRLIIRETGVDCRADVIKVPVTIDGIREFDMSFQRDLIVTADDAVRVIGSIKTSSKDRLDKVFIDKFMFNRLVESDIPHIAIFLCDVQRKRTKRENEYAVNATFLPGHFKCYTTKLCPLDGVYYCDIRPNMLSERILMSHIKTFDSLIVEDIWRFL
ncbi:MAG: hypothetical protein FWD57_00275 [Polyangiaceae bacterium]|nr:hypothetical protein [Polyangiaceae bacterium]